MSTQVYQIPGQDTDLKLFPTLLILMPFDGALKYTLLCQYIALSLVCLLSLNIAAFFLTNVTTSSSLGENQKLTKLGKNYHCT